MIAILSIYPRKGASHCSKTDHSALAGYSKSLFGHFSEEERRHLVVLTNRKTAQDVSFTDKQISVLECWQRDSPIYPFQILKTLAKLKDVRIVHLQHEFNQFGKSWAPLLTILLLGFIRFFLQPKIVITLHEVLDPEKIDADFLRMACLKYPVWFIRWIVSGYYRTLVKLADLLLVQDEVFVEIAQRCYRPKSPVHIVRIGTSREQLVARSSAKASFSLEEIDRTLVFFGTLDQRKGLDLLLEAWSHLPNGYGKLLIAGGRPSRVDSSPEYLRWWSSVEKKISSLCGIQTLGYVDDQRMVELFSAADLLVLPYTVPQRVSAVLNQAASFGVPAIVSDVFEDLADPQMVFPKNAKALVEKILWAFDGHLSELAGISTDFRKRNSWEKSAKTLSSMYCQLDPTCYKSSSATTP